MGKKGKIIILSAPSGSGKSTVIRELMKDDTLRLGFSVSATSRAPRGKEQNGVEYYFLTPEEFRSRVEADQFVEWEEVYAGCCYGTLKSEVQRVTEELHRNLIMDVDVKGAMSIKERYGADAKTIFLAPPSLKEMERRLRARGTDTPEVIAKRLEKAGYEMSFAGQFDHHVVNDDLRNTVTVISELIHNFID